MAIQYPGGTIVNTTFTGATKTNIVNNLETQLTTAGWSVISGSGTGDVILESATTPTSNNIRVRLRDSNLTNCACLNFQNAAATKVGQNFFLLPAAGKTFRVVANKYQFFCFTPGTSAAREFVMLTCPYVPSFLSGVVTGEFAFMQGNGQSDSNTAFIPSLRTQLDGHYSNFFTHWSGLVNGSLIDRSQNNGSVSTSDFRMVVQYSARTADNANGYRWHDDSIILSDPLLAWGLANSTDEAKIRGQVWGAFVASDSFAADTTLTSVDSHNWHAITGSNSGDSQNARGTLFVATS